MKDKFNELDPILSDVLIRIIDRYEEGRRKYGGSMETNVKPITTWILDAQEEAIELSRNEQGFAKTLVDRWIGNKVDYSDS